MLKFGAYLNFYRVSYFLLGLFTLGVGLLNLFLIPINTVLNCHGAEGFCISSKRYFFYSREPIRFKSQDILQKEIVTHGTSKSRGWSLRLETPETSMVVGEYKTKEAAQEAMAVVESFQRSPAGKTLYINGQTDLDHSFGTLGVLLTALLGLWFSLKPPKNFRW